MSRQELDRGDGGNVALEHAPRLVCAGDDEGQYRPDQATASGASPNRKTRHTARALATRKVASKISRGSGLLNK